VASRSAACEGENLMGSNSLNAALWASSAVETLHLAGRWQYPFENVFALDDPCWLSEDVCSVSIAGWVDKSKFRQNISSLLLQQPARSRARSARKAPKLRRGCRAR
jgi:hypothetical protein